MTNEEKFSAEVCEKLEFYVYELVDPRNGQPFYVGKGKGNRVFDHEIQAKCNEDDEELQNQKIRKINEIKSSGLEVIYIIVRHGMNEKTALEVESALIDAIPGLINMQSGFHSDYGIMNVRQISALYKANEIDDFEDKCLIIKITQDSVDKYGSIYNAVNGSWVLNPEKADKADYILAVIKGLIVGIFKNESGWQQSDWIKERKRFHFEGKEVSGSIKQKYVGKRIGKKYMKRGMASPILYTY